MAWSVLQSASATTSSSTTSVAATFGSNLSSGTKLICYLGGRIGTTAAITSVTDGNSNTFTLLPGHVDQGQGNQNVCILVLDTPAGDVGTKPTITASWNSGAHFESILVQEVSGLVSGSSCLDGTAGTTFSTSSGTIGPPTYSSTAANEYLAYVYGDIGGATWTAPGGYTSDANSINGNANASLAVAYKNSTNGSESGTWSLNASTEWGLILVAFQVTASAGSPGPSYPLIPPGRVSPMAYRYQAFPSAAPLLVPVSDSDNGSGADSGSVTGNGTPAFPLTPPGRSSPQAFQWQRWPSQAPVLVPVSDSDSGSGADSAFSSVATSPTVPPLIPPGRISPAGFQFQAYPSAAPLLVPASDSDSGSGSESSYAGPPVQSQVLIPPGRISPAGWQWRTLPSGAPLLVPVSDSDSGSGADSGSVFTQASAPPYQLIPPGRSSPMALGWQRYPSAVQPAAPVNLVSDSDGGSFADTASAAAIAGAAVTGGWWQLDSIIKYAREEREFYASRPPMACPRCGEPMRPSPPSDSGSEVELYCLFDGWQYPRDWRPPLI